MFQILNLKREGFSPTLKNQEQMERILLGWDSETVNSDLTYKTKVWGTTRPVLHLAAALFWILKLLTKQPIISFFALD